MLAALAIAVSGLAPAARADTITQNVAGNSAGGGIFVYGQSVTTPATGGPWSSVIFNLYNSNNGTPYAIGTLYLLDREYLGTPAGLSTGTLGYIAAASASGGTWAFNPSVTLQPGGQYWFYMNTAQDSPVFYGGDAYAGGTSYLANNSSSAFVEFGTLDFNFTLQGTSAPGPLPGAGLLSYLVVCCGGIAAFRKRMCARAASLLAVLRLRRRMETARC